MICLVEAQIILEEAARSKLTRDSVEIGHHENKRINLVCPLREMQWKPPKRTYLVAGQ